MLRLSLSCSSQPYYKMSSISTHFGNQIHRAHLFKTSNFMETKLAPSILVAMASSHLFIILATLAIVAPSILATDFVVGDNKGWTINFDYQTWAQGKQFYVGDKLVFKYPKGVHNVHKVNGTGFQQCAAPLDSVPLTSGNDVVTLATPGRKWYICGVGQHCKAGNQKLLITVMPSSAPSPSPSYTASSPSTSVPYTSAATGTGSFGTRHGWMAVIFGLLMLMA